MNLEQPGNSPVPTGIWSESARRAVSRILAGSTTIQPGEGRDVLAAGWLFSLVLTVVMVLRPVREALGLTRGIEHVRELFFVTLAVTLVAVLLFGRLVARVRRDRLLTISFRVCALLLLGFSAGLTLLPEANRPTLAAVYYVYHSVFNLFVVSLFWAFMADLFSLAESKRLFPAIAIGGTLGAIAGSVLAGYLAPRLGVAWFFVAGALLARIRGGHRVIAEDRQPIGGHSLAGITKVVRSPYLLGIGAFIVLAGVASTFLYFTGLRLVAAASSTLNHRAELFAHINVWTQVTTLLAQAFLAARIMRFAGVATALSVLPGFAACGVALLPNGGVDRAAVADGLPPHAGELLEKNAPTRLVCWPR